MAGAVRARGAINRDDPPRKSNYSARYRSKTEREDSAEGVGIHLAFTRMGGRIFVVVGEFVRACLLFMRAVVFFIWRW